MSVILKNMDMPYNCAECSFSYYETYCRQLTEPSVIVEGFMTWKKCPKKGRLADCPLVPVPDHGRLIDTDALRRFGGRKGLIHSSDVDAAPTVIETDDKPVVHSHWEWDKDGMDWGIGAWRCSECHARPATFWNTKHENPFRFSGSRYCGNCGARMDEVKDDG